MYSQMVCERYTYVQTDIFYRILIKSEQKSKKTGTIFSKSAESETAISESETRPRTDYIYSITHFQINMSSSSRLDDLFVSLPTPAKMWMFIWTYLAVSGWFSTYMLISTIGGARRNNMIETIMPEGDFIWTVAVMMLASMIVMGLLFYGRYTRKKKDVVKEALKDYEETNVFVDPKMRFDPAVLLFWIGGSVLNVLFSLSLLIAAVKFTDIIFDPSILYALAGFGIAFFAAVPMYLITQFMANGVLDAKAARKLVKAVIGSDEIRKLVGTVCSKLGIADKETVDRVYEAVRNSISAAEYSELTPDEILLISKVANENTALRRKDLETRSDGIFS